MLNSDKGFTLLELLLVLSVLALLLSGSVPYISKMYSAMQYRSSLSEIYGTLSAARLSSISSGISVDVVVSPTDKTIKWGSKAAHIPEDQKISVVSASFGQSGQEGKGIIRFFPDGSSTGGSVFLESMAGKKNRVVVDWLYGKIFIERTSS